MVTVYPASKSRYGPWWRALRAAGMPISPDAHWIDWAGNSPDGPEPTAAEWGAHWQGCIAGVKAADVLLILDLPGDNAKGALIELGAALAFGKTVFLVSDTWRDIEHHPRVQKFRRLEDAIAAIRKLQGRKAL
jgi:Nucleoside 2-deoxyribosyltransferase